MEKSEQAKNPQKEGNQHQEGQGKQEKKVKKTPAGIVIPPKKPKLSKAERRALQEAQRAAKASKQPGSGGGSDSGKDGKGRKGKDDGTVATTSSTKGGGTEKKQQKVSAAVGSHGGVSVDQDKETSLTSDEKTLDLFSHLSPYKDPAKFQQEFSGIKLGSATSPSLHPAVISLGQQYASGTIQGANARCKAMLRTFQLIIQDYSAPPNVQDMRQDLDHRILKPAFQYWTTQCRTHSVTMGNAFTFFKLAVANLNRDMPQEELKENLIETIDAYIAERIDFADKAISKYASTKIKDGDVILTFARSEVIEWLLINASTNHDTNSKKNFRVICVDSRPLLEGRKLLEKLTQAGIECTYILLNSLSYVMMREVTKVFLGAGALMSDGSILSRAGTACVALMARSKNVPVLFCCETYKISNRVTLESITGNELGNPQDLVSTRCAINRSVTTNKEDSSGYNKAGCEGAVLKNWRDTPNLKLLNLMYDLTPSQFVSGIVTEMGILPPTSVAVLLREMNPQEHVFKSDAGEVY